MMIGSPAPLDFMRAVAQTRAQLGAPPMFPPFDLVALLGALAQIEAMMISALATRDPARVRRTIGAEQPRCAPRYGQPPPSGTIPAGRLVQPGYGAPPSSAAPIAVPPRCAPPSRSTEAQSFDHYAALAGAELAPGERHVVSLRTPTNTRTNGGSGAYDDTTAVIWKDEAGVKHCQEVRSNTEPAAHYEGKYGQDADGNGSLDQGRLRAGTYEYTSTTHNGRPAFRMEGDARVDRDTNHDGTFGNDGGASSLGGGSMLFHAGGSGSFTGSAGCQTMPPEEYAKFLAAMGESGSFKYTLIDR